MIVPISGNSRAPLRPRIEPRRKAEPLSHNARARRGLAYLGTSVMVRIPAVQGDGGERPLLPPKAVVPQRLNMGPFVARIGHSQTAGLSAYIIVLMPSRIRQ